MHFCTLFDSNYISKGIAMYMSLQQVESDFVLYVMAMDRKCHDMLTSLGFDKIRVECINDIDDSRLWDAESNRSRAEFCWTCGSYVTDYFLHKYSLPDIVYLDSDLMFFSSPRILYDELESRNASIGLAPHFMRSETFGKYCVQFVYFKHDDDGCEALRWWRDECLKWCYNKLEDGRFGDQKYLDSFHLRFRNVVDIENRGCGVAYWNLSDYDFEKHHTVFFHYSGLNAKVAGETLNVRYSFYVTRRVMASFIRPYAELLVRVFNDCLGQRVSTMDFGPLERRKYFLKALLHYMKDVPLVDDFVDLFMRMSHRRKRKLYSSK